MTTFTQPGGSACEVNSGLGTFDYRVRTFGPGCGV
jgi:hypothetical protein